MLAFLTAAPGLGAPQPGLAGLLAGLSLAWGLGLAAFLWVLVRLLRFF
ncbi:hypothetical protein [Mangrovicoccus ximenensis]|nr:hypothetical protein [Mangrovicoccus ximenensis]